jgi:glycosyltransferase involved in cell wall biosynthesis
MLSVVIPVYRNEASLPELIAQLSAVSSEVAERFGERMEVVFVVDGSPDRSFDVLAERLPDAPFASKLLRHSRNFGSFPAIRTGLAASTGECVGVIAADLQEPPELLLDFFDALRSDRCDVVVGCREGRADPAATRLASSLFWRFYRRFVIPEIPASSVDVFGCNRRFRDELLRLEESNSSLVGLIFWLGFRRREVTYSRRVRRHGRSAWTFRRKLAYLFDSIFSFTDLPIRLLISFGTGGILISLLLGAAVLVSKLVGDIEVPGYAATALTVLFFGGLNALGLGIVGTYAWRAFENTKGRPLSVVSEGRAFEGRAVDVHAVDAHSVAPADARAGETQPVARALGAVR